MRGKITGRHRDRHSVCFEALIRSPAVSAVTRIGSEKFVPAPVSALCVVGQNAAMVLLSLRRSTGQQISADAEDDASTLASGCAGPLRAATLSWGRRGGRPAPVVGRGGMWTTSAPTTSTPAP